MTYKEVVEKAKREVIERIEKGTYANRKVTYGRCPVWEEGSEINLWSYWQGYQIPDKDSGIDILLVGQDWGNPDNDPQISDKIRRVQEGEDFIADNEKNPTNRALIEMFGFFDCDIRRPVRDKRIFFTNYSLGYRTGSEQGGMTKTLMKQDSGLFCNLVDAIKPQIIICLGRLVFECVTEKKASGWIGQLKQGLPFEARYPGNKEIKVYGVAHCGNRGINNIGGKEVNSKAWEKISEDYKRLYC